jgi:hypothetical protein
MTRLHRPATSPALIVSLVALVVALGGTSYAAFTLPRNSVGTKQLKNRAVTTKKIKNGAVTGSKMNFSGVTVPNAKHANGADSATDATNAGHATSADTATNASHAATADLANSLLAPEGVHEVGAPGEPPFENGNGNAGAPFAPVGFYIDRECVVHLVGTADAGSGTTLFTLPAADRPGESALEGIAVKGVSAHAGYLVVSNTGEVELDADASGEFLFGLDGVNFRAATC